MPANIAKVQLSDTFNQWITQSNTTIDEVNTLLNGSFVKSGGTLTANGDVTVTTNGRMYINKTDGTTLVNSGNTLFQKNLYLGTISNVESRILSVPTTAANTVSVSVGATERVANTLSFKAGAGIALSIAAGTPTSQADITVTATGTGGATADEVYDVANLKIETLTSGQGIAVSKVGGTAANVNYQVSANTASSTVIGVTKLYNSTACTATDGAATAAAVNTVNTLATSANTLATSANTLATTANTTAVSAYNRANQAFGNVTTRTTTSGVAYYSATNNVASAAGVTYNSTLDSLNVSSNAFFTGNIVDTPISVVTTSSTFADNSAGKILYVDPNSTGDVTVTFAAAQRSGFATTIVRGNVGNVVIANVSGVEKVNSASFTTSNVSARYEAATVVYVATNKILVLGSIT